MYEDEDELELREVGPGAGDDGDRLQESVVGDAAAVVSTVFAGGGLVYARAQYNLARAGHDRDELAREALLLAAEAENRYLRAALDAEMRELQAQLGYINLGVDDDDQFYGRDVED